VVTDGAKVRGFITHANGKPSWKDGSLKNKRMLSPLAKLTKVRAFNLISEENTHQYGKRTDASVMSKA